jgi:hypothetical protein
MKLYIIAVALFVASACSVQSGITQKSVEKYAPTPVPSVSPTPVEAPIDPADVVEVDTTLQGTVLSVNRPKDKTSLNCNKYDRVMVNAVDTVITIKGACSQIMINGDRNDVTAEAVMSIIYNGTENKVRYSKYGNGKRPMITENKPGNTTEKVSASDNTGKASSKTGE